MSDSMKIPRALADEMVAHCEAERPNEACGVLAGDNGECVKVFKMTNSADSPVRYRLDGRQQIAAQDKIDEEGWDLLAVFHSHTRTEAYPSPTDVREAVGDHLWVIVSLAEEPASIRAFRIVKDSWEADTGEIEEVPVVVSG